MASKTPTDEEQNSELRNVLILGPFWIQSNRLASTIIEAIVSSNVGYIVHQARQHNPAVHASIQADLTAPSEAAGKIITHEVSFTSSESLEHLFCETRPDVVFSTSSAGSFDTQKLIIDACIDSQIPRFVAAEWSYDTCNDHVCNRLPPHAARRQILSYLESLSDRPGNRHTNFTWTAVATGTLLDTGIVNGNLGFDLKWRCATISGTGDERFAASSNAWRGQVACAILENWTSVVNRYLHVAGTITSANELVSALQQEIGGPQEWNISSIDVEDTLREADARMERGWPDAAMFLMERSVMYDVSIRASEPFEHNDAKNLIGLEAEDVRQIARRAVHHYEHHGDGGCGCD